MPSMDLSKHEELLVRASRYADALVAAALYDKSIEGMSFIIALGGIKNGLCPLPHIKAETPVFKNARCFR